MERAQREGYTAVSSSRSPVFFSLSLVNTVALCFCSGRVPLGMDVVRVRDGLYTMAS